MTTTVVGDENVGFRRLVGGGAVYAVVGLLQRVIGFVLLPFYTRVLSPAEYGQIGLLLTVNAAAALLLSFGLDTAIFRGYFAHDDAEERRSFLGTLRLFTFVAPHAATAVISVPAILLLTSNHSLRPANFLLELESAAIVCSATVFAYPILRARRQFGAYAFVTATFGAAQIVSKAVFVLVLGRGVTGWVLSDLVASLAVWPVAVTKARGDWPVRLLWSDLKEGLRTGLPLMPHLVGHWALAFSDRIVLAGLVSTSALGLYSFGYQVVTVLGVLFNEFNSALMPEYGRAIGSGAARHRLPVIALGQVAVTCLGVLGASLLLPPLFYLLLPISYRGSADVVALVALGFGFYGLYYVPTNVLTVTLGNTKWVWIGTVAATVVNVMANLALVPHFGISAAAFDTALAYLILLMTTIVNFRLSGGRRWLSLPWSSLVLIVSSCALAFALSAALTSRTGTRSLLLRLAILSVASGAVGLVVLQNNRLNQSQMVNADAPV